MGSTSPSAPSSTARIGARLGPDGSVSVLSVRPAGTKAVFDLTVEGQPEFFVEGVLVHNCLDAARNAALVWTLDGLEEIIGKPKWKPVFDSFVDVV